VEVVLIYADGHNEVGSVIVKIKGLVSSKVCCEVVKKIFLMFLNARGIHNEEFYNFTLQ
jgi:3,4-dihydroxy-2-butanone 4-phosphate synthase